MMYRMHFGPSKTPLEITEDLNVNIISYDGKELIGYRNSSNRRGETRLGDTGRSTLRNRIPVSGSAGSMVSVTGIPE